MLNNNRTYNYLWAFVALITIFIVDNTSVISYLYTLLLVVLINKFVIKANPLKILNHFHYYLFCAIGLYLINKLCVPEYIGLTGPEGGIGTDDCRYYTQLVNGAVPFNNTYHLLPVFYPFTYFLDFIYPFSIHTPLNVVIVNLLGVVFLPSIVNKFSLSLIDNEKIAKKAELLMLICPFTTYFGCILMRDMWVVSLVLLGLYFYSRRQYLALGVAIIIIGYIRFGSLAFLFLGLIVMYREQLYKFMSRTSGRFVLIISLVGAVAAFVIAAPYIQELTGGKLEEGLFRTSFIEFLISQDSDNIIAKLAILPFPISTITLTIFFFFLPFLNLNLYFEGTFLVANLLNSVLTPIFFLFLWRYIIKAILCSVQNRSIKTILYIAILFALALGTISLQFRHKTVLMPILCILAAIGMHTTSNRYSFVSILASFMILFVQLAMVFI